MTRRNKEDFEKIKAHAIDALKRGINPSFESISREIGVPSSSLKRGLEKYFGITTVDQLLDLAGKPPVNSGGLDILKDWDGKDHIEDEINNNVREVRSYSGTGIIKTLDDLIREHKIDIENWVIAQRDERAWGVPMKLRKLAGKPEEQVIVHEPIVVQLHYVSVRLLKKEPEAIEPVVQPVELYPPVVQKRKGRVPAVKRALIAGDAQMGFRRRMHTTELTPFHDRRIFDLITQMLTLERFDDVLLAGDWNDLSEWSAKFTAEPEFYWTTQPMIIEQAWWLSQWRQAAPNARFLYFEGNHDKRMRDLLVSNYKQAYGLRPEDELRLPPSLSIERLLCLHKLEIEYLTGYPDNKFWLNENLAVQHGDIVRNSTPGATSQAYLRKKTYTTIYFHTHRREMAAKTMETSTGRYEQTAFSAGCCCHVDGRVPGSTSESQWQQGVCVVEYTDESENIIPVAINEGKAIYGGKQLQAADLDEKIDQLIESKLATIDDEK